MRVAELRYTLKSRPRPEQITNSRLFIPSPYTAVITDCYQNPENQYVIRVTNMHIDNISHAILLSTVT